MPIRGKCDTSFHNSKAFVLSQSAWFACKLFGWVDCLSRAPEVYDWLNKAQVVFVKIVWVSEFSQKGAGGV